MQIVNEIYNLSENGTGTTLLCSSPTGWKAHAAAISYRLTGWKPVSRALRLLFLCRLPSISKQEAVC